MNNLSFIEEITSVINSREKEYEKFQTTFQTLNSPTEQFMFHHLGVTVGMRAALNLFYTKLEGKPLSPVIKHIDEVPRPNFCSGMEIDAAGTNEILLLTLLDGRVLSLNSESLFIYDDTKHYQEEKESDAYYFHAGGSHKTEPLAKFLKDCNFIHAIHTFGDGGNMNLRHDAIECYDGAFQITISEEGIGVYDRDGKEHAMVPRHDVTPKIQLIPFASAVSALFAGKRIAHNTYIPNHYVSMSGGMVDSYELDENGESFYEAGQPAPSPLYHFIKHVELEGLADNNWFIF